MPPQTQATSQPSLEIQPPSGAPTARWSLLRRIALRFGVVYFLLFTLWIPVHFLPIPPIPQLYDKYRALWRVVIVWVGERLLHLQVETGIPNPGSGSKDTTFHYVQLLCYVGFAVAVTVIWSLLDRKRPNYERLQKWFWLYLRMTLGFTLIGYGAAKVFPAQMPPPSLITLLEPFGESLPCTCYGPSWERPRSTLPFPARWRCWAEFCC